MARDKATQANIDGSDLANYPNKRIRDNSGAGDGTPVDEKVYGDIHEYFAEVMRQSKTTYNGVPDNKANGYQLVESMLSLPTKNDLVKGLDKVDATNVKIPIKIAALKPDESLEFKASFDSANTFNLIQGSDNISKNFVISGAFKSGDFVKLLNTPATIYAYGLYNSQNVPNLPTVIQNITNIVNNLTKFLSVFQPGFGMILFNKPANEIPDGWSEVVNWRGRFPVGLDELQDEFNLIGKIGGLKARTILNGNLPPLSVDIPIAPNENSPGRNMYARGNVLESVNFKIKEGPAVPMETLNPYRVVLFIEFVG